MEKIKILLESHVGKGNEVSAQVIEDEYGKSSDKTHRKARELIDDCIEDSRIKSLQSEIKSYNYDGTPLKTPKNEKKLLLYIKSFLENISRKISRGELSFKKDFKEYLRTIKAF